MFVVFFLLWLVLNGRITLEIVLFGIGISAIIYAFLVKVLHYSPKWDLRILKNFPLIILYILNLIREVVKAAFAVMSVIVRRAKKPDPVVVDFHSGLTGSFKNVLLANSITLTPGTYTVFQEQDHFVVHCLRREYADGLEDSSFVRLLRRFI